MVGMYTYMGDVTPVHKHYESLVKYYAFFERGYNKTGMAGFMTGLLTNH